VPDEPEEPVAGGVAPTAVTESMATWVPSMVSVGFCEPKVVPVTVPVRLVPE
jgi:hypothetical protein